MLKHVPYFLIYLALRATLTSSTCESHEKECADGTCIPLLEYCGSCELYEKDCPDGRCILYTEICSPDDCPSYKPNKCAGGGCYFDFSKCDGFNDCADGTDEVGCPTRDPESCQPHERDCGEGVCVDQIDKCPGEDCYSWERDCGGGICVSYAERCPGEPCRSYEKDCGGGVCVLEFDSCPVDCYSWQKYCPQDGTCVDTYERCPGECYSYEKDCGGGVCKSSYELCPGEECPLSKPNKCGGYSGDECYYDSDRCDGIHDCDDGSDEAGCYDYNGGSSTDVWTAIVIPIIVVVFLVVLIVCCLAKKRSSASSSHHPTNVGTNMQPVITGYQPRSQPARSWHDPEMGVNGHANNYPPGGTTISASVAPSAPPSYDAAMSYPSPYHSDQDLPSYESIVKEEPPSYPEAAPTAPPTNHASENIETQF